jgi:hypothetical protein
MKKAAQRIWMISHSMSQGLSKNEQGFMVENPIMDFVGLGKVNAFHTLDCFVCCKGKHTVFMRIVHLDSRTVIQGTDPFVIEAEYDGYTYSYTIGWQYKAELAGLFEYQVWADGQQIGTFRFCQHEQV